MKDKTKAQLLKENIRFRKEAKKRDEQIIGIIHDKNTAERQLKRSEETAEDRRKSLDERKASISLLRQAMRACYQHSEQLNEAAVRQASGYTENNSYQGQPDVTVEPQEVDFKTYFSGLTGFIRGVNGIINYSEPNTAPTDIYRGMNR